MDLNSLIEQISIAIVATVVATIFTGIYTWFTNDREDDARMNASRKSLQSEVMWLRDQLEKERGTGSD